MALWICTNLITKKLGSSLIFPALNIFFLSLGLTKVKKNIILDLSHFFFHVLFDVADFCCDMYASRSGNCYQACNDNTVLYAHTICTSATQDNLFLLPVFWAITIISVSFYSSCPLSDQLYLKTDMKSKSNFFSLQTLLSYCIYFKSDWTSGSLYSIFQPRL